MIDYQNLWDTMVIGDVDDVVKAAELILKGKPTYDKVVENTKVPWYFVGALHYREASCNFSTHLHNGDSLKERTKHVPAGRPVQGNPPFTWEESAKDALFNIKNFDKQDSWTLPEILYRAEAYNGLGYSKRGVVSPYVWSKTNHYKAGKYASDGKYDSSLVDKQVGVAPLIRYLTDKTLKLV